jgi:multiple sugar transport system substrate-binding protein
MFVSEQFVAAGEGEVDDLDFFPYPNFGTEFDAEKALDAPIDGFMIAKNSPSLGENLDGAKAFMEFMSKGSTQNIYTAANPGVVAAANDADTSGYNALQQKAVELISGAQRITQFLDRDTNPNFAGPNGMQAFLLDFIQNPDQDLDAFLGQIQSFWDTL